MKKKRKTGAFHDIHPRDERLRTVSLREHKLQVELGNWQLRVGERQALHFIQRNKLSLGAFVAVLVIATVGAMFIRQGNAETTVLYPASCLGGWKNTSLATGQPVTAAGESDAINEGNAASLVNASAEMYCGGFAGDIPAGTKPVRLTLVPYWRIGDTQLQSSSGGSAEPTPSASSVPPESTISPTPAEPTPVAEPTPPAQETPTPEPAPTPQPTPSSEPSPTEPVPPPVENTSAPTPDNAAVFTSFVRTAHAQEVTPLPSEEAVFSTDSAATTADAAVAELRYTLDGKTWSFLGTVNRSNWQGARFTIPAIPADWNDAQNVQISISPVATIDAAPAIYIDGFVIEAAYERTTEQELASSPMPTEEIATSSPTSTVAVSTTTVLSTVNPLSYYYVFAPSDIQVDGAYCAVITGAELAGKRYNLKDEGTCFSNDNGTFEVFELSEQINGTYSTFSSSEYLRSRRQIYIAHPGAASPIGTTP